MKLQHCKKVRDAKTQHSICQNIHESLDDCSKSHRDMAEQLTTLLVPLSHYSLLRSKHRVLLIRMPGLIPFERQYLLLFFL